MWRFEFPGSVIYRFRDANRLRAGLSLVAISLALLLLPLLLSPSRAVNGAFLAGSILLFGAAAFLLFSVRNLIIDRTRRLLVVEERRPFRKTLREIVSLDCSRLRIERTSFKGGRDSSQSLWLEDQCGVGRKLMLLERHASLRADTTRLESDLGRPLLVVVQS